MTSDEIRTDYNVLRQTPGLRQIDIVERMGITEGQLLAAFVGETGALQVHSLGHDYPAIFMGMGQLGEVMALTRNPQAVHEKYLRYTAVDVRYGYIELEQESIALSIDSTRLKQAFYVIEDTARGVKHSLQWFDQNGVAVHKVFAVPPTQQAAFTALAARFETPEIFSFDGPQTVTKPLSDVNTPQVTGMTHALNRIAQQGIPVVIGVTNHVSQQYHRGVVSTVNTMGPWLNVLDPLFNLHLRIDQVTRVVFDAEQIFLYANEQAILSIHAATLTRSKQEQWLSVLQDCHDIILGAI